MSREPTGERSHDSLSTEEDKAKKAAYMRAWAARNRDKVLANRIKNRANNIARCKRWHEANKDKIQAYRDANKAHIYEVESKWRVTNREKLLAQRRAYYAANRERFAGWRRKSKIKHRAKYIEQVKERRKSLPLLMHLQRKAAREKRLEHYRETERKAEKRSKRHGFTPKERQAMYDQQNRLCKLCHQALAEKDIRMDHDHACHPGEKGCKKCVRGMVHPYCNILIGIIENHGITFEMIDEYLGNKRADDNGQTECERPTGAGREICGAGEISIQ